MLRRKRLLLLDQDVHAEYADHHPDNSADVRLPMPFGADHAQVRPASVSHAEYLKVQNYVIKEQTARINCIFIII